MVVSATVDSADESWQLSSMDRLRPRRPAADRWRATVLAGVLAGAAIFVTPVTSGADPSETVRQHVASVGAKVESNVKHGADVTKHAVKRAIGAVGRGVAHAVDRTREGLRRAGSSLRDAASRSSR